MNTIVFGGGCFWCTEAVFLMLRGVVKVESGYAGGGKEEATYAKVSEGKSGHAEVIRVTYDPEIISLEDLYTVFFGSNDPTTSNRQGADVGAQYRSVIFYQTEDEKKLVEKIIADVDASLRDGTRAVTQLEPLKEFFLAEDYHQNYFRTNYSAPYCELVIEPKIESVRKRFAQLMKQDA